MIEQPRKENEPQEISPEKGWVSFLIRLRQEVVEEAQSIVKMKPEEEEAIWAKVDMLDGVLKEIGEAGSERRKQLIENFWQEGKIPEDIYKKLEARMEAEAEFEKLARETESGQEATKEKITGPEAAKAAAETVEEVIAKNPFWSKWREKISGAGTKAGVKSKEVYEAVSKTLQEKKVFGVSLRDHLVNMGTGAAVRTTTRWGLGFLTGGAGYLFASGAGAISGGILEGRRSYKKEMGREQVALSEEEFEQKVKELRGKKIQEKLESYLETAKIKESQYWSEEKNKLRQELEKTLKSKEAWVAFRRGFWKGAVVGALGGAAGSALSDIVGHFFAPEKAAKGMALIKGVKDSAAKAVKENAEDAAAKAYEKSIGAGLDSLHKGNFHIMAAKGDGQTQLARKLIMSFIVQDRALGSELNLDKAQLIYAEDFLQKNFARGIIQPGQTFFIKGEKILEAMEQARNLSEEQLQNIQENFVPKISEETWEKMTDYDSIVMEGETINAIKSEAERKAGEAMNRVLEEAAQMAAEAKNITPEIAKAGDSWFGVKYFGSAVGTGALVGLGALAYKLYRERGGSMDSGVGAAGFAAGQLDLPGIETKKQEKITGETNLDLRKTLTERIGNSIEIARSNFSTGLEMEHDGLKRLEQLVKIDKSLFEKIKGSLLYMTTDKNAEIERSNKGRFIIPIDPRLTLKQMRHYLEDAAEKIRNLG